MPVTLFKEDFRFSALTSARTGAIPVGLQSYCCTKDDKGGDAHRSFLKFKGSTIATIWFILLVFFLTTERITLLVALYSACDTCLSSRKRSRADNSELCGGDSVIRMISVIGESRAVTRMISKGLHNKTRTQRVHQLLSC